MSTTQGEAVKQEKKQAKRPSRRRAPRKREEQEFAQQIIDIARVTRVTEGGKQMSFRATVVIGDKKGRVGVGIAKGKDVTHAINKAVNQAKKNLVHVKTNDQGTIPHEVTVKFGAAKIMMRPAAQGTGVIAGGVLRMVLEIAGVKNVVAKMYGSNNKINNAKAAIEALSSLK